MNKKTLARILLLALVLGSFPRALVFAEDDTLVIESLQTIDGSITGVDEDRKQVDVRWMADNVMMKYQDVTLTVPDSATITKNADPIEFRDLENGDHVTVRFNQNAVPMPQAVSISVVE